ncbi:GATOR complex protein WDR59 isoform X2 [Neolamprologus brichardi]|uniref:GATOR complex protein WDR59 isoform X2 n=1 Tax=Neolamprologus brichardi TaxID=32507 RepID=UPI001643D086|nr:GATOR complex protein WDR59 isoform X2 [Neolamprologus brichardi]
MAARWSSENVVVEFRDAQATAMSVDCLGSHAVLSGRRFLYLVNLELPSEPSRKIGRQSKWDVGTVQWNPHRSDAHVFAASSNQRVDLYSWRDGCGETHTSLQGHTRVISDLDWSWFEPEFLVTSSVDTYIYIWDTRDTRKPTLALSAVAGASQVKWNKKNQNLLASSHDGDVRIWDKRKPNTAAEYVAAHLSKIHGLDWHPDSEFIFATSSQDNSVRFWDYRQPRKYLNILSCQVPVWKARYTPFSNGLVTVMVPQLRRENSLLLWSTLDLNSPVHAFVGHDDVVLEFQWRPQKEGSKDYQLVTWSRDQTLRIWRVDPQLQKLCVSDVQEDLMDAMSLTAESEKPLSSQESEGQQSGGLASESLQDQDGSLSAGGLQDSAAGSGLAQTLQQEFSLVNLQIRNVNVEMDALNHSCVVSAHFGSHQVHLVVKFPAQYPNNAAPTFQFVSPTTIPSSMKTKIQKILRDTSLQKVKRNQNCLEPCVRQLVSCLESDMTQEDSPASGPFVLSNPVTPSLQAFPRVTNTYGSYQDANIPFPRTSGARFCGTGCLVYFTRPITMHRSAPPTEPTPRSLSALSAYHSGVLTPMKMRSESQSTLRLYSGSPTRSDKDTVSISSFYYKERLPISASRRWSVQTLHDWPVLSSSIRAPIPVF